MVSGRRHYHGNGNDDQADGDQMESAFDCTKFLLESRIENDDELKPKYGLYARQNRAALFQQVSDRL